MTLHSILNKYNLHTFSPDVELTDDEAQKADECCFYIRALLQKGWNTIKGINEQYSVEEYGREYFAEKEKDYGRAKSNTEETTV